MVLNTNALTAMRNMKLHKAPNKRVHLTHRKRRDGDP